MYHFITKKEYFSAIDVDSINQALSATQSFGLKHTQDACVLHQLYNRSPGKIAEIGGGHSRTLPFLASQGWRCWNIETFEGVGNGPRNERQLPGIIAIRRNLGEFSPDIPDNFFDAVYSISVIEHVPDKDISNFFEDMYRILKKGGISYHAIDVYLEDKEKAEVTQRIKRVLQNSIEAGFALLYSEPEPLSFFRCHYATNPDLVIRAWNKSVPRLISKREVSQSVSLLLGISKT